MFEGFANWFQGNGWVSNAQLDERKKKETQDAALAQARASVPFAQYDPSSGKFTNKAEIANANANIKALEMPNIVGQFSPQQLQAAQQNPSAPWSQRLQIAAKQQELLNPFKERPKTQLENYATVSGNIPVWNVVHRLGAWAAEGLGNLTGNKGLAEQASNFRSNLDLGMSNDQMAALPQERQDKLRALQAGVELASPLDLVGITGLVKAPIVTGIKQGAKEIITGGLKTGVTSKTKALLKQGLKQQGKGALIGGGIGGVAGPAIQAYVNDGQVDWGQVPGSIAIGSLWGAGIPNIMAPTRNTARRSISNSLNDVSGSGEQVGALTLAKQRLFRTAAQIEEQAEATPTSTLGRIDDGISSKAQAAAKRQEARLTAQQLREQASQIPNEAPRARQITTQDINNPETAMVLQRATPEQLLARDAAGDAKATAEIQRRLDEAQPALNADTTAPAPEAIIPDTEPLNTPLESPITRQSREVAEATPPVAPDELINVSRAGRLDDEARWFADDPEFARSFIPADDGTGRQVLPGQVKRSDIIDTLKPEGSDQLRKLLGGEFFDKQGRLRSIITENRDSDLRLQQALSELEKRGVRLWDEAGGSSYYFPGGNREAYTSAASRTDPRISQLYQEAKQHLTRADEILAKDGTDVAALGEKLYVADANNTPAQLTPAEQRAFDYLNSNINDAERVLMSQGIIDKDLGVRRNYLPTGDEAGIERVFTPEDINTSTFNYAKGRSGGFIRDDGTVSDKLPKGIRAAYTDYYVRGKGSQYLSDTQVDGIKSTRIAQADMNDMMFGPTKEPMTGIDGKPAKIDSGPIRNNASELVSLERNYSKAVKGGDEKAIRQAQKEVNQKTIDNSVTKLTQMKKQVNDLIAETKASNLTREQKTARIVELENRLDYAQKQARYEQSYVKTNMLFQIPGRVADQVGKLTQSIGDAFTAPLASRATKAFRPDTKAGKQAARTVAGDANLDVRRNNYQLNKQLNDANADNILQKAAGRYTAEGTRLTEYGSRQSAPTLDTARYFAAQAEAQGVDNITEYIRNAVGTKEWDRVFNQFSTNRNRFSGIGDITGSTVREGAGLKKGWVNSQFDSVKKGLNDAIDKAFASSLPRSVRRNMADAISIPFVGFPRVVWNVGAKGMDYATFGMSNLYKASRINVVDSATALQKALILRDAIDGAAAGTGLVGLGVLLGQSDMITGSEPEKQANGEWTPPYSLKLGNDYVELGRFIGPYAVPIMIAAAISRGDSAANIASIPALVTSQVLNNFGADSIGDTMSLIGDVLNGDETAMGGLARRLPNVLSAFGPFSSQINSIANATDPYQRDTKDDNAFVQFMQQLASKVPGLRQQLDAKEDQFGNKIPSSPLRAVIPISTVGSGWSEGALGQEANRLKLAPGGSSNTQENAEDMAGRLIESEWYKGLDDKAKKAALQSVLYSGKLGDINDSLSDESKNALAIGTLMSPGEREKWLESASAARDYHVAAYENAVENGTLTAKNNSLENSSSLHYKAVASQVNAALPYWDAELEQLYKETSKAELYAMSPDNPIRQKLLALDAARAGAGVSLKSGDHSANKYGDGTGSGSGGKNFSFASSTAANAEKSGFKQPTVKAGFDATLVKPLGIGEASESVKRKISVKRGVQL